MALEGTAISLGQVKPSAQAVGSPRPRPGGMAAQVLSGFFLWMFTPPPPPPLLKGSRSFGTKGTTVFGGGPGTKEKG